MRNKRLDILRCVAILLVLGRHGLVHGLWWTVGWSGVDLFFVLSGFLISGLLFTQYLATQSIQPARFYIRRFFKICPAFWAMLLASACIAVGYGLRVPLGAWLRELFFVQNYSRGVWRHTWSLAVEEHFYCLLPLFLMALIKISKNRKDPFRSIPQIFCFVTLTTLGMRYLVTLQPSYNPEQFWKITFLTHLRFGALFCGVTIGYFYYFRPGAIPRLVCTTARRFAVEAVTAVLLSACVLFPEETRFMQTIGLTLVSLGFAGLLILCLTAETSSGSSPISVAARKIGSAMAFVGRHSYSIYLWHVPIVAYGLKIVIALSPVPLSSSALTYIYAAASIPVGILMARVVEFPAVKLRDKLFPRLTKFDVRELPGRADMTGREAPESALA